MLRQLYSNCLFPYLCDYAMSGDRFGKHRLDALKMVEGKILEIGFGTGLNLQYYSKNVESIDGVDVNEKIIKLAQKRINNSKINVTKYILSSENLPMVDHFYDYVVSTFTLCSIQNIEQALSEIYRVLKPEGKLIFLEHGLSEESKIRNWQNRLNPIQKIIGEGCHLNRDIPALLKNASFKIENLKYFNLEGIPKIIGCCYQGAVRKS